MEKEYFLKNLGKNIRHARIDCGMQQKALAHDAGVTKTALTYIEQGKNEAGIYNAFKIAQALGVSLDHLIKEPDSYDIVELPGHWKC